MTGKAIVAGGSVGGLFAAAALRKAGWEVDVYERTEVELAGRGAGIVTHPELVDALTEVGAATDDLGVAVERRVVFDKAGVEVKTLHYPQIVTSWERVHRLLRTITPDDQHHLGRTITGYRQTDGAVAALFDDGSEIEADVLVGADGFRSAVRGQMLPEVQPEYSGYVVWRTLIGEDQFPPDLHKAIFADFGFYMPQGDQVITYPIAGENNDLRPGHRRYNFVWYTAVPEADLADYLTDASGVTHDVTIPPPLVREEVVARMMEQAEARLAAPFFQCLQIAGKPFFTPIYDHHSPVMAEGRVALAGDAACVARPHVGMGVTKAACDALSLAAQLSSGAPVPDALQRYSAERVPAARAAFERSRLLGSYIFQPPAEGHNADGRNNPNIDFIMEKTAVTI